MINEEKRKISYRKKYYEDSLTCETTCFICDSKMFTDKHRINKPFNCCSKECSYDLKARKSGYQREYYQCHMCDKLVTKTRRASPLKGSLITCGFECRDKYWRYIESSKQRSDRLKGIKPRYTPTKYGPTWKYARDKARELAKYLCLDCKITEADYGQELSVHHITPYVYFDSPEEANALKNLVAICEPCHRLRHSGEHHASKFDKSRFGKNAVLAKKSTYREKYSRAILIIQDLIYTDLEISELSEKYKLRTQIINGINSGRYWSKIHEYQLPLRESKVNKKTPISIKVKNHTR